MATTLVLGLGNLLLSDDGVGVRACERLLALHPPGEGVEVIDGGTLGLHLLPYLEGVRHLVLVDAVRAALPPGALVRLAGEAIPAALAHKTSLHQLGLAELLALARLEGAAPERVVLWGMVPATTEPGLELSPPVAATLDALVRAVAGELGIAGAPG